MSGSVHNMLLCGQFGVHSYHSKCEHISNINPNGTNYNLFFRSQDMHLTYVYIGSGKNGNACCSWGRMKKQCRTVDGILADFDKKSFRNLRRAEHGARR